MTKTNYIVYAIKPIIQPSLLSSTMFRFFAAPVLNCVFSYYREKRKIVVLDGIPYYQSTGMSSGFEGIWLPFIAIRQTGMDLKMDNFPKEYFSEKLLHCCNRYDEFQLIKESASHINPSYSSIIKHQKIYDGRIPTRQMFIGSARLGTFVSDEMITLANLSEKQKEEIKNQVILEDKPEFETDDISLINRWLVENGAIAAKSLSFATMNNLQTLPRLKDTSPDTLFASGDPS